jgi:hypothetical protein
MLDNYSYKSTQERDLVLITDSINLNVNNPEFEDLIVSYFDKDNPLSNQLIYKGICFIGYDSDKYPTPLLSKTMDEIKSGVEKELQDHLKKISTKINSYPKLASKEIHVFLLPFPSVKEFRKYYLNTLK